MTQAGTVTLKSSTDIWYAAYVDYAIQNGIIEETYRAYTAAQMNAPVSRTEFVHILCGARKGDGYTAINEIAEGIIPDLNPGQLYRAEIYTFYRAGILTGSNTKGSFFPDSTIRRCEAAAILIRIYDLSARVSVTLP